MAKTNNKNKKFPSDQDINGRRLKYNVFLDDLEKNDFKVEEKKETVFSKLGLIKNELSRYRGKGISFSIIKQHIEENVGLKISEQSLRIYCQNNLGFPKGHTKKKQSDEIESSNPKGRKFVDFINGADSIAEEDYSDIVEDEGFAVYVEEAYFSINDLEQVEVNDKSTVETNISNINKNYKVNVNDGSKDKNLTKEEFEILFCDQDGILL